MLQSKPAGTYDFLPGKRDRDSVGVHFCSHDILSMDLFCTVIKLTAKKVSNCMIVSVTFITAYVTFGFSEQVTKSFCFAPGRVLPHHASVLVEHKFKHPTSVRFSTFP